MPRCCSQAARLVVVSAFVFFGACGALMAQEANPGPPPHDHAHMNMGATPGWQFMQDGMLFVELNDQGGPRGGTELKAPNWWMGMATRDTSRGRFTFTSMLSLDPATVGEEGYREIFQAGEAYNGRPLIDRQHPHNLFMQLAGVWRVPLNESTGLTLAGGPAGEPALGPVAFMHRASAADNPTAPLGHHTFDSTHISFGVVTAAIDRGSWVIEGSIFNGREPDQNRWDFDFGPLDSVSGRVWFRPSPAWEFQASTGHLVSPEALEPGNIERTTASASWTQVNGADVNAVSAGYGRNDETGGSHQAVFVEGERRSRLNTIYGRFEMVQADTDLLLNDAFPAPGTPDTKSPVVAITLGAVRDVLHVAGFEGGFGADVTFYGVPSALQAAYGAHPVSFHVFFRLRPPAGSMGRMRNMRMSQPMQGMQSHVGMQMN
jgi:hypothetical protein